MTDTREMTAVTEIASRGASADDEPARLLRPAWARSGDRVLDVERRGELEAALTAVAGAVGAFLDLPVRFKIIENPVEPFPPSVSGIALAVGDAEIIVELDEAGARSIVDPVLARETGLRGAGAPLEPELGVLDWAALNVIDALLRENAAAPFELSRFVDLDVEAEAPRDLLRPLAICTRIGAITGMARVWIPLEWTVAPPDALLRPGRCALRLALPALELPPEVIDELAPDDFLLLGSLEADSWLDWAELVTTTGWTLGRPAAVVDHAAFVHVVMGDARPAPQRTRVVGPHVRILIGEAPVDEHELARLSPGSTLTLAKADDAPLELLTSTGARLSAEATVIPDAGLAAHILKRED